ncbi:MAG: lytic murein transglycosylase [Balneolaceae bacterium]|nr:lytic murein transglycosylase [Balneolaceae bacterium]
MNNYSYKIFAVALFAPFLMISTSFETDSLNEQPLLETTEISTNQQYHQTYPERLTSLIEYFKSKDLDLQSHLDHPKFEIYDGIGDRFRKSAERKIGSLEDYLRVLGYEDKKGRIGDFIKTHYNALQQAEQTYNIPKFVIAAIIGIESDFGQNIGSYNPLNVYVSMYTEDYRADFAKAQLEELLLFTERNNIDVFELKSSYAGAMSYGQFIPYSINRWFVGDDIFDMENNIHSIGNYLAHFHEVTGSIEGAVYRYNPSSLYRDAVLTLADEAEQVYRASD